MDMLTLILMWASGFVAGWWLMGRLAKQAMIKTLTQLDLSEEQLIQAMRERNPDFLVEDEEGNDITHMEEIRIEKVGDQLYAYKLLDDSFVAQGTDAESLMARMHERYTNKTFSVDEAHGAEYLKT